MNKINYMIGGRLMPAHDAAIILPGEDLQTTLVETIVNTISTDVEITLGGVKTHLAALMDPDHWSEDWEKEGIEDVDEWLAGLVEEET